MSLRLLKIIQIIVFSFIFIGHFNVQAYELHEASDLQECNGRDSCDTDHRDLEICNKIQDYVIERDSLRNFILPSSHSTFEQEKENNSIVCEFHYVYLDSYIPIDHQQLARSHLS